MIRRPPRSTLDRSSAASDVYKRQFQAYSQTLFFYGQQQNVFYDPVFNGGLRRSDAQATSTIQGGSVFGIYPFNRYRRIELSGGLLQYKQSFNDPSLQLY